MFLLGFVLFCAGIAMFALASTAGEPEVFLWMIAAVLTLGGSALCMFETSEEDFKE